METTADIQQHQKRFYMPPTKRCHLQGTLTDTLISEYQHTTREDLKETINEQVNIVKNSNVSEIAKNFFQYNIIRGRGVLQKLLLKHN
ncbi:unnamed protein product [Rotaria magnacalcarata]|uniref:Uncharacterized protein n=1 Tax=Rotaria magnacalcarata TaxID=392030 RepID=A0A816YR49_9BILA|nr:unnamed protein product [Rotaria magnacalcarata]CAF1603350.1 unnamed protein product [Rotaria magnacalcarata]CAF1997468.1 unnamed protein product [Rotaria magnacalcarata]CAF2153227.1 unnamed protein product [Rotaria magnacalcarata]CAF2170167.1 unnamed protein product [Rotaria magnacalcarata]